MRIISKAKIYSEKLETFLYAELKTNYINKEDLSKKIKLLSEIEYEGKCCFIDSKEIESLDSNIFEDDFIAPGIYGISINWADMTSDIAYLNFKVHPKSINNWLPLEYKDIQEYEIIK